MNMMPFEFTSRSWASPGINLQAFCDSATWNFGWLEVEVADANSLNLISFAKHKLLQEWSFYQTALNLFPNRDKDIWILMTFSLHPVIHDVIDKLAALRLGSISRSLNRRRKTFKLLSHCIQPATATVASIQFSSNRSVAPKLHS